MLRQCGRHVLSQMHVHAKRQKAKRNLHYQCSNHNCANIISLHARQAIGVVIDVYVIDSVVCLFIVVLVQLIIR